jgi:hypothetical protein
MQKVSFDQRKYFPSIRMFSPIWIFNPPMPQAHPRWKHRLQHQDPPVVNSLQTAKSTSTEFTPVEPVLPRYTPYTNEKCSAN